MSQGHGTNVTHSAGLELAEASLGRIVSKTKIYIIYIYAMLYLVRSKRLKHGPAMPQKHVAASGSINSARQATDYDKGSLVCVRAQSP